MTDPFADARCTAHNMPLHGPQSCLVCDPDKQEVTPMIRSANNPDPPPLLSTAFAAWWAERFGGETHGLIQGQLAWNARDAEVAAQSARIRELEVENAELVKQRNVLRAACIEQRDRRDSDDAETMLARYRRLLAAIAQTEEPK